MFERSWTVFIPSGVGPQAVQIPDLALPGGAPNLELEAWGAIPAGPNVFIIGDGVQLAEAQQRISAQGEVDCLLVVPRGGIGCVRIPPNLSGRLTVFSDANIAQAQAITVRLRQR